MSLRFSPLFFAALLVFLSGCRKRQLSPSEIRAITGDLVAAARSATGGRAEIGVRPERIPPEASGSFWGFPGDASRGPWSDHVYITLPSNRAGQTDPAALDRLEKALDRVANQRGLKRESGPGASGLVRFDYRWGGRPTHRFHIITMVLSRPRPEHAGANFPLREGGQASRGRLAIVLDDLGYERAAADAVLALGCPLTLAVLPHLPYSADIAEEAHRYGYQVILHLPMESSNHTKAEAKELRPGMSREELSQLLGAMLDTVPHAAGVNNHQGSLATRDSALMTTLMLALRERDLFFIDSRTTGRSVAYDAALRAGVPAAYRKVFLDDVPTREAVAQQLSLAVRDARREGFAIAIGHPHPATIRVLEEYLPQLEAHGVHLVFASELVR